MIPFKGRLGMKQYVKSKPTKWGIKAFLLCDSATAYCYRFEIYIAKNSVFEGENLGLTTALVLNLTKGTENMGHILYTDNFYTSPVLAYNLKNRGIGIVGTVRKNRKCYPKQLADVKDRDLHKGECKWMMSDGMLALVWKDNRLVHLLSTVHQPDINVVLRRNKQGVLEEVRCPQMVKDYNSHMGGVDRNDQMCHYSKSARQYRWYMRLVLKGLSSTHTSSRATSLIINLAEDERVISSSSLMNLFILWLARTELSGKKGNNLVWMKRFLIVFWMLGVSFQPRKMVTVQTTTVSCVPRSTMFFPTLMEVYQERQSL